MQRFAVRWARLRLISNAPQDAWESTRASLGNPSNVIDRDELYV